LDTDRLHESAGTEEAHPVVLARDCLFADLTVESGLAQLEYCTLLGETRFARLQASDCLFEGLTGPGPNGLPTTEDCIRYSRIPARLRALRSTGLVFPFCTSDRPVFFHTAFAEAVSGARPGCGVLHPAAPASLCFGAEDGGELGAYHAKRYCLRAQAVIDKALEHLPVGLEPVLVPDAQLNHPPPGFGPDGGEQR
jgi:hypothetical protein